MYPNSRKRPGSPIVRLLVAVAVLLIFLRVFSRTNGPTRTWTGPGPAMPAPSAGGLSEAERTRQAIERALTPPATAPAREGIAAAILIDTSGSMAEQVADADGRRRPKIEIAQRCVRDLIRTTEEFAKAHPEQPILLGVYEFSVRNEGLCRAVVPLGEPNLAKAEPAIQAMRPQGGTPIGQAVITAKNALDATGMLRQHILVITDGMSNHSFAPGDVLSVMSHMSQPKPAAAYFVAFDTNADQFAAVKQNGAMLLSAANEKELQQTVNTVLTGRILVERPE